MEVIIGRRIQWDREEYTPVPEPPPPLAAPPPKVTIAFEPKKSNGHKTQFVRKLLEPERDIIKIEFCKLNGQLSDNEKESTRIRDMLDPVVSIWQVTGYISVLHRYIAFGNLELPDLQSYLDWIKWRCKGLWANYNSPLNKLKRENKKSYDPPEPIPEPEPPDKHKPKFTLFPMRRRVLRSAGG